jgi:hypothetical protein
MLGLTLSGCATAPPKQLNAVEVRDAEIDRMCREYERKQIYTFASCSQHFKYEAAMRDAEELSRSMPHMGDQDIALELLTPVAMLTWIVTNMASRFGLTPS